MNRSILVLLFVAGAFIGGCDAIEVEDPPVGTASLKLDLGPVPQEVSEIKVWFQSLFSGQEFNENIPLDDPGFILDEVPAGPYNIWIEAGDIVETLYASHAIEAELQANVVNNLSFRAKRSTKADLSLIWDFGFMPPETDDLVLFLQSHETGSVRFIDIAEIDVQTIKKLPIGSFDLWIEAWNTSGQMFHRSAPATVELLAGIINPIDLLMKETTTANLSLYWPSGGSPPPEVDQAYFVLEDPMTYGQTSFLLWDVTFPFIDYIPTGEYYFWVAAYDAGNNLVYKSTPELFDFVIGSNSPYADMLETTSADINIEWDTE